MWYYSTSYYNTYIYNILYIHTHIYTYIYLFRTPRTKIEQSVSIVSRRIMINYCLFCFPGLVYLSKKQRLAVDQSKAENLTKPTNGRTTELEGLLRSKQLERGDHHHTCKWRMEPQNPSSFVDKSNMSFVVAQFITQIYMVFDLLPHPCWFNTTTTNFGLIPISFK